MGLAAASALGAARSLLLLGSDHVASTMFSGTGRHRPHGLPGPMSVHTRTRAMGGTATRARRAPPRGRRRSTLARPDTSSTRSILGGLGRATRSGRLGRARSLGVDERRQAARVHEGHTIEVDRDLDDLWGGRRRVRWPPAARVPSPCPPHRTPGPRHGTDHRLLRAVRTSGSLLIERTETSVVGTARSSRAGKYLDLVDGPAVRVAREPAGPRAAASAIPPRLGDRGSLECC